MATAENRQIVMVSLPEGEPKPQNFKLVRTAPPEPGPGQVLVKTQYLSLDPYMRGRMSTARSYAKPLGPGDVVVGQTVSKVVASKNDGFKPGDTVLAYAGWQDYAAADPVTLRKIDPQVAPVSTGLGVLGMPGMTAYTGLLNIGAPKPGETVVVAAATGPVGSAVGQIAKLKNCRAVGIAGGPDKCRALIEEFGFDAAVDHRDKDLKGKLAAACPKGIDVYFENVGGAVFEAVVPLLNDFARIPVCGLVAHYNDAGAPPGPNLMPLLMRAVLTRRLLIRGFIVSDYGAQLGEFLREMSGWLKDGKVKYREDVVEGLEKAPEAFIGLLKGKNFGKLLVKVASD